MYGVKHGNICIIIYAIWTIQKKVGSYVYVILKYLT